MELFNHLHNALVLGTCLDAVGLFYVELPKLLGFLSQQGTRIVSPCPSLSPSVRGLALRLLVPESCNLAWAYILITPTKW